MSFIKSQGKLTIGSVIFATIVITALTAAPHDLNKFSAVVLLDNNGECLKDAEGLLVQNLCCPGQTSSVKGDNISCQKSKRKIKRAGLIKLLRLSKISDRRKNYSKSDILITWDYKKDFRKKKIRRFEVYRRISSASNQDNNIIAEARYKLNLKESKQLETGWALAGIIRRRKAMSYEFKDNLSFLKDFPGTLEYRIRAVRTDTNVKYDSGIISVGTDLEFSARSVNWHKRCQDNNGDDNYGIPLRSSCEWTMNPDGTGCDTADDCNRKVCKTPYINFLNTDLLACEEVNGAGSDECSATEDCNHKRCVPSTTNWDACTLTPGEGDDDCTTGNDCNHSVCELTEGNAVCQGYRGKGDSNCDRDIHCNYLLPNPTPTGYAHKSLRISAQQVSSQELGTLAEQNIIQQQNTIGDTSSPIIIEVYQDLTCSICRSWFRDQIPQLINNEIANGRARLVFRDFPLGMSEKALPYHIAARCAGKQGEYYDFLQQMYADSSKDISKIQSYAEASKIDLKLFSDCLEDDSVHGEVRNDVASGRKRQIRATPAIVINGKLFIGNYPYKVLSEHIQDLK